MPAAWGVLGAAALVGLMVAALVGLVVVLACSSIGRARRIEGPSPARPAGRQAQLRAQALLLAWLSPHQRKQYRARGWFDVITPAGHRYRIRRRQVVRLNLDRFAYCLEADPPLPVADEMLAKKLLLETDEARFLATAHRYR